MALVVAVVVILIVDYVLLPLLPLFILKCRKFNYPATRRSAQDESRAQRGGQALLRLPMATKGSESNRIEAEWRAVANQAGRVLRRPYWPLRAA